MATLDSDDLDAIAARLLVNPANKLWTSANGGVDVRAWAGNTNAPASLFIDLGLDGVALKSDVRGWKGNASAVRTTAYMERVPIWDGEEWSVSQVGYTLPDVAARTNQFGGYSASNFIHLNLADDGSGYAVEYHAHVHAFSEHALDEIADVAGGLTTEQAEQLLATYTKVIGLGAGTPVYVVSPVSDTGTITINRGDSYLSADGRALSFINPDGTWPDLTDAELTFTAKRHNAKAGSAPVIQAAGTAETPSGPDQLVTVELESAATEVRPDEYSYDLQAELSSGAIVTLTRGTLTVEADVTRPVT